MSKQKDVKAFRKAQRDKNLRKVLVDGVSFTLRRIGMKEVYRAYAMHPGWLNARLVADAMGDSVAERTAKQLKAEGQDFHDFCAAVLCSFSYSPKIVMTEEEADDDESGQTVWIDEISDEDRDRLGDACLELLNITREEAREYAPFRESAAAGSPQPELGSAADGSGEEPGEGGVRAEGADIAETA